MSALFHPYLCGRIAAEWLIAMKKALFSAFSIMLILILTGCGANPAANQSNQSQESSASHSDQPSEEPIDVGTVETFTQGELALEVSHVKSIRTESKLAEGIEPFDETIFTCYPDATLTVINADMSDPAYAEDHKAHPQWGLYDIETDTRTRITDETKPILLDETTDGVFDLEASIFVLRFEFAE